MKIRNLASFLLAAAVGIGVFVPTAASAFSYWSAPQSISDVTPYVSSETMAMSASGSTILAAWVISDGYSLYKVQVRAGTLSNKLFLWGPTQDATPWNTDRPAFTKAVISADGTKAIIGWARSRGEKSAIVAKTVSIAANQITLGPSTDLSSEYRGVGEVSLGMSDDGTKVTALWAVVLSEDSIFVQAKSASLVNNIAYWAATQDLSRVAKGNNISTRVQVSRDGSVATASWSLWEGNTETIQSRAATITSNVAKWGPTYDVGQTPFLNYPSDLAFSRDGRTLIITWVTKTGPSTTEVRARIGQVKGNAVSWSETTSLSAPATFAADPCVAISMNGSTAVVGWQGSQNSVVAKTVTIKVGKGVWGPTQQATSSSGTWAFQCDIAMTSDGSKVTLAWWDGDYQLIDGRWRLMESFIRAATANISTTSSTTWGSPVMISRGAYTRGPAVAVSGDGAVAAIMWNPEAAIQVATATADPRLPR